MQAIFTRELQAYFKSPLGYIFLTIFFYFGGQFLSIQLLMQLNQISLIYSNLFTIILFTMPILTMRLMSEDKRLKTDQALLTAPVSLQGIVWGKFLAAFTLFTIAISITVVYFVVISSMATTVQYSMFFGNLIGTLLLGGALISIGLFISSLTESQMVAAILSFATMFMIMMLDSFVSTLSKQSEIMGKIVSNLSFMTRYKDFTSGILNLSHIVFFVSVIAVFNFLTVRFLEKRRWG